MRGGIHGHQRDGKRAMTRPIQSIDQNVTINRVLWVLAEAFAN